MALTARQRNALPRSAFAYAPAGAPRSQWKFPVPTAAQARRAGIPEGQRQRILRNAASRAAQRHTAGSYGLVAPVAKRRSRPATRGAQTARTARRGRVRLRLRSRGRRAVRATTGRRRGARRRR